jgi:AraC-like DNA-binding protein
MPDIVALLAEPAARDRLRRVYRSLRTTGAIQEMHEVASWEEVEDVLQQQPTAVVVVDPYFGGQLREDHLQRLRLASTSDLVLYSKFGLGADVLALGELGIRRMVTLDGDDSLEELRTHILDALGWDEIERVLRDADRLLTAEQLMSVRWAVRLGGSKATVAMFANEMGSRPRTIRSWWAAAPEITPLRLLGWGRILHVSRLLSQGTKSVSAVAQALGFEDSEALRRAFKKVTGLALGQIDREELMDEVARLFLSALARRR